MKDQKDKMKRQKQASVTAHRREAGSGSSTRTRPEILSLTTALSGGAEIKEQTVASQKDEVCLKKGAVVVTGNDGSATAGGNNVPNCVAIGGYDSYAIAWQSGLEQVLRGDAVAKGDLSIAVVRSTGTATVNGAGAVAIAMSGSQAIIEDHGIAIALNDRHRFDTTAMGTMRGGVLIFAYYPEDLDGKSLMKFAFARLDDPEYRPGTAYRVNPSGKIVAA